MVEGNVLLQVTAKMTGKTVAKKKKEFCMSCLLILRQILSELI